MFINKVGDKCSQEYKKGYRKVSTLDDYRICRDLMDEVSPYCHKNYGLVVNYMKKLVDMKNLMIVEAGGDIQYIYSDDKCDIYFKIDTPLMQWKDMGRFNITRDIFTGHVSCVLFVKCCTDTHTFLIVVKKVEGVIQTIEIIDTCPFPLSFNVDMFEKRMSYVLNCVIPKNCTVSPLNNVAKMRRLDLSNSALSFQTIEKHIVKYGYCNAWLMYFIYHYISDVTMYDVYDRLVSMNSNELQTLEILEWWNSIFIKVRKLI